MDPRAAEKVFNTVELMEMILLKLPMRTLFTIQATNMAFQASIKSSSKLKQKMFLEDKLQPLTGQAEAEINPLLWATILRPGQHGNDIPYWMIPHRTRANYPFATLGPDLPDVTHLRVSFKAQGSNAVSLRSSRDGCK